MDGEKNKMAETALLKFAHKEVAEALIKQQNIHEGLWGIYIEFGLAGANVGQTPEELNPAAIVAVTKIGLQKFPAPNPLTVDAAVVNPDRG